MNTFTMRRFGTHRLGMRRFGGRRLAVRTLGFAAVVGALTWFAVPGGAGSGSSAGTATEQVRASSAADEAPGYAVEDFDYPGADKILAEQNITLKRGDGHILLAVCGSATDLIQIKARGRTADICFRTTGSSGYLTVEIPSVYTVKGNAYTTQVDMTNGTEQKTFDITKNAWTAVGESVDGQPYTLLEIRSSK
jgi:hypothetical protein